MEIARLYLRAQQSFVALVELLSDDEWATSVPCTPGWTVRDVLSHVAGLADDALNGRMAGAPGAAWTAAQVDRWRDMPRRDVLDRWTEQAPAAARLFEEGKIPQPPFDCHMHEHDVRHALGRPGNRDSELLQVMLDGLVSGWEGRPVELQFSDAPALTTAGAGDLRRVGGLSSYDLVRSYFGRRSRAQVAGWQWSEPLSEPEFDAWFRFGPSAIDIVE